MQKNRQLSKTHADTSLVTTSTSAIAMVRFTEAAWLLLATLTTGCNGECYFPIDIQGTYLLQQSNVQGGISYSEVIIDSDSIPPWGHCHKRRGGSGVILRDPTGIEDCMRCLHLSVKSNHVVHIQAEGLDRCYTTEEAARLHCPDGNNQGSFEHYILYRKDPPQGVFCPFTGRFRVSSYQKDGQESRCLAPRSQFSEVANCPRGDKLAVKFRSCSFPDRDEDFVCLGDWEGANSDERFVALMDTSGDPKRAKYRCGLYRQDPATGRVYMSLAADSTCHVVSAHNGYETFMLGPIEPEPLPPIVERAQCTFPEFTQGPWGDQVNIDEGTMIMRDPKNDFSTQTIRCLLQGQDDRFPVHSISQCGEETYSCVKFQRRSQTVVEFQFGTSDTAPVENLCAEKRFTDSEWVTQGRNPSLQLTQSGGCPIVGDYTGIIPGSIGLCARIASDCNNPDIMFYTVYNCDNATHIYEEREYKCLGSWEEDDGVTYSFTHRRDVHGFQCFSGKILRSGEEAYIREAGDSCGRGEDPSIFGMKVIRQSTCTNFPPKPSNGNNKPSVALAIPPTGSSVATMPRLRPGKPAAPHRPAPPSLIPSFHDNSDPYWYRPVSTKPWKRIKTHSADSDRVNEIPSTAKSNSPLSWTFILTVCMLLQTALIK
ncbi:uncharacterized protein LOC111272726 [Varroa jacobsoni]|uniref:uncharacterized protein LOC111272726 n=1 Tax=Varroa jacobsoni TaxID=62625 RepID=UPI000BFA881E|nr:uncharacterized protein LOC111272726 [Varroa jacobsoni]